MIVANRNGHIACTQGGESLAGLQKAVEKGYVDPEEVGVLDSTAHMLKFALFQEMYFNDSFDPKFDVHPRPEFQNAPVLVRPETLEKVPEPGRPLAGEDMARFIREMTAEIAKMLDLKKKS
jgi:threonine synthase